MAAQDFVNGPDATPVALRPRAGLSRSDAPPRTRYRSFYRRFGKRRTPEERAKHIGFAVRCMIPYALCRLQKSMGRPISLNQTAMAKYFADRQTAKERKRWRSGGPSRRTIIRAWSEFAKTLAERGYHLVRVHSVGVGSDGKKRKGTKQRKLGWVCYAAEWEAAGNSIFRYANQDADPADGLKQQCRWARNQNGALLAEDIDPKVSTVSILPPIPLISPSGSRDDVQKDQKKQDWPKAGSRSEQAAAAEGSPPPPKRPIWRIPDWALRTIWWLCRHRLGRQAEPLAFRGIRLWEAGMRKGRLFNFLERAAAWGGEAESGNKGAIAAAFLAKSVMNFGGSMQEIPSNEQFSEWLRCNTASMREKTVRRCREYLRAEK